MHKTLVWNIGNALNNEKKELMAKGAVLVPSGVRLSEEGRRDQERFQQVKKDLKKCRDAWEWHTQCDQQCYKDPIFLQQTEGDGDFCLKRHIAKKLLVKRVYSGLKNLSEQVIRGEELLEIRARVCSFDDG